GSKNKVKYTKQTLGKGVLQKLNKAGTAAALKKVVNAHAKEIGLDLAAFKKLGSSDQNAALKEVLSKKPKSGYASLAKFRSTFNSAVTAALTPARKKALQAINGASTGAKMKQALRKHDAVLGLNLDRYKLSDSRQNTLASRLVKLRPFKSRKELRRILQTTVVSIRSGFKIEYKRYNYTLKTMLEKQMKVKPQTDLYGGGWKNAKKDDVQSQLDPLNIIKISYSQSFPADHLFQFLLLSGSAGTTAADLNKILKNKGTLHKTGSSFLKAGQNNKINEIFLVSLALHESGNGTSALARGYDVLDKDKLYPGGGHQYSREARVTANSLKVRTKPTTEGKELAQVKKNDVFTILDEKKGEKGTKEGTEGPWYKIKAKGVEGWVCGKYVNVSVFVKVYNMFGIGAVDSSPTKKGAERAYQERWFTPAKAILGGAKFASERYVNHPSYHQDTLYKMRWNPGSPATHQYATDIGWASKQVSRIRGYYDLVDKYTLTFEIPRYK
ncbi:MAG: SH3 domain-containing protein, partial [Firmicutes bacterium]|nr:SH3 domain-containing protein [Bacillota bacterium]